MIIIIKDTPDLETDKNTKLRALENLVVSHGECKHVIWMPTTTASQLAKTKELSEYAKRVLVELESFAREARGVEQNFSFHVVVDFETANRLDIINNKEIHAGYSHFKDTISTQKATFLTENLRDAETFEIGAEVYLQKSKLLQAHKISLNKVPGGGNTTYDQFQNNVANDTFFLCIIDSDLKHPKGPIGSTAGRFRAEPEGLVGKRYLSILKCHEIENILPLAVLKEASNGTIEQGLLYKQSKLTEYRAHPDHKAGLCAHTAKEMDERHQDTYWSDFYAHANNGKPIWLLPPLGANILSDCLRFMSENSTKKISEYIDPQTDTIWWEASMLVASWGIAPKRAVH